MFYRPEKGKFKDATVFYEDGIFYLFSMWGEVKDTYSNVWLATSPDGVHFVGVGPVIRAPFPVWAMNVHKTEKGYILNHGSFTKEGVQGVIKFWISKDLRHWEYMGEDYDMLPPPGIADARLDCMPVLKQKENGKTVWYGYPTCPWPLWKSEDGLRWTAQECEGFFDWKGFPPTLMRPWEGAFEVAGCIQVRDRYYYLGGWFNYLGHRGYHVHVLTADNPGGPFSPDVETYRLSGNSRRWVNIWARPFEANGEQLTASYMNEGTSYECGETWFPPIKRVDADEHGHLRLYWWKNNEAVKGDEIGLCCPEVFIEAPEHSAAGADTDLPVCSEFRQELPFGDGVVIEFDVTSNSRDDFATASWAGIYLEETEKEGTAIWTGLSGSAQIGCMEVDRDTARAIPDSFRAEDCIDAMSAAATRLERGKRHHIRLLVRRGMFEWYIDDVLAQTFNTSREQDGIGRTPTALRFLTRDGYARFENLRAWKMSF